LSEKTLEEALADAWIECLEGYLQQAKEIRKAYGELPQATRAKIEAIPKIDLAELEQLPWMKWKKDEQGNRVPAGQGEPGWIKNPAYFTGLEAPQVQLELAKALARAGGKLELGEYLFSFSGKEKQFITRRPVKREKAKDNPSLERMDLTLKNTKEAGRALTGSS